MMSTPGTAALMASAPIRRFSAAGSERPSGNHNTVSWPTVLAVAARTLRLVVAIVVSHPLHGPIALVATLGCEIEQVVGAHHGFYPAPVSRVGVEDLARVVPVEDADAGQFLALERLHRIVVADLPLR